MASVAESSLASVPIPMLDKLHEHMLKHCPEPCTNAHQDRVHQPKDSTATAIRPEAFVQQDEEPYDTIPESLDVHQPVPASNKAPPRLSPSKSAPKRQMDAMVVQASPSQDAFNAMTRANSYHPGFEGGDTQPMDTQIYRTHLMKESMAKASATTPKKTPIAAAYVSPMQDSNTYATNATDKTPKTYREGDAGFMDLAGAFQPGSPAQSTSDLGDLLETQRSEGRTQDAAKRTFPQTPALAGNKRNANGEVTASQSQPTAAKKTPGFTQMFGTAGNAPAFSATQLFNQTQAPSSPLPNAPRSDPVVTRPSPNMNNPYSVSSPEIAASSPMETLHKRPRSTGGEPRDAYTSMRESQERRAARLRQELEAKKLLGFKVGDDEESEEDSDERRLEQRRMQRVLSDRSLPDLARLGAPMRSSSRPTSSRKKHATIDLVTPATARKGDDFDFPISDDGEVTEDEGPESTGEAYEVEDDEHGAEDGDDVYDELAQTVLKSQGGEVVEVEDDDSAIGSNERDEHAEDDHSVHEIDETLDAIEDVAGPRSKPATQQPNGIVNGTQPSAIADSQPQHLQAQAVAASQRPRVTSSYVPGSQHAGRTSQDRARAVSKVPDSSNFPKRSGLSQPQTSGGMPSSPPRVQTYDTVPEDPVEASHARKEALARFQQGLSSSRGEAETVEEVPESDLPERSRDQTTNNTEINNAAPYSTAQTHVSGLAHSPAKPFRSPAKIFASQQSKAGSPSPRKAAGVSRFIDIANESSIPDGSGEASIDVDAIMGDVFTAEDREVAAAISSPPSQRVSKRRRIAKAKSVTVSPVKRSRKAAMQENSRIGDRAAAEDPTPEPAMQRPMKPLQSSPSRANQMPEGTAEDTDMADATPDATPHSVRMREEAGARAASQLVQARLSKAASAREAKMSGRGKKMAKDGVDKAAKATKPEKPVKLKVKTSTEIPPVVQNDVLGTPPTTNTEPVDQVMPDAHEEDATEQPPPKEVTNPLRVFALFKGQYNNFYPATWLLSSADGQEYRVRFDDTTVTSIASHLVCCLQLQPNDIVKVDLPGMKKNTYVVQGVSTSREAVQERPGEVDAYGNTTVKVQAKASNRNSFAADGAEIAVQGEAFDVHLSCVYLTHSMWSNYFKRTFTPPAKVHDRSARYLTPSTGAITPSTETPTSRSRRGGLPQSRLSTKASASHLREASVASSANQAQSELFANMAFAISYGSHEEEKAVVISQIERHGGTILSSGFDELFDLPNLDSSTPATPTKRSPRKETPRTSTTASTEATTLRLKPRYEDLGFVALISDHHSRRAKYVQALALGLPTLHGRWVLDSLDQQGEAAGPLPWTKYLLPAGESSYLHGAVRSRTLPAYNPATAKLADSIKERQLLLENQGVLIVAPKKGKATWEKRKAYAFLTLALGAGFVRRVGDVEEAKGLVGEDGDGRWRWVYVEGGVGEAAKVLFGGTVEAVGGGKKRKRGEGGGNGKGEARMSVGDGRVKVVNDEFVVQSLILGALVD